MEATPPPPAPAAGPAPGVSWPRAPRSLPAGHGLAWWSEGWKIFTAAPVPWILVAIVLIAIHFVLSWIPLLGSIASAVLTPVLVGGLMLGCHGMAQGRPFDFMQLFDGFRSDRLVPLAILGAIMFGASLVVGLVVMALVFGAGAGAALGALGGSASAISGAALAGAGGAALLAVLVGLALVVACFLAFWFATPLVAVSRADAVEAIKGSFRASLANLPALLVFLLIFVVLALLASIPFGLGWLVLAPVAIGAVYASWREVYAD